MGIVNLTPDSFFAPSRVRSGSELEARINDLIFRGCTILDFGAVSTRPGATDVPLEEEWRRLSIGLRAQTGRFCAPIQENMTSSHKTGDSAHRVVLSVDTFRAEIVRRVYNLVGPFIVNDISAGEDDPEMLSTVAGLHLPYIAMHKRGNPRSMDTLNEYPLGVTGAVLDYFEEFSIKAGKTGIKDWILDPGFGFAKNSEQNWELLGNLKEFRRFGKPILVGVADKRFTKDPKFNRGDPSYAERLAVQLGTDILRIH